MTEAKGPSRERSREPVPPILNVIVSRTACPGALSAQRRHARRRAGPRGAGAPAGGPGSPAGGEDDPGTPRWGPTCARFRRPCRASPPDGGASRSLGCGHLAPRQQRARRLSACVSAATCSAGRSTRLHSFAVLDAYARPAATSSTPPTSTATGRRRGGESERIIGRWMAARGNRDDIVIATKVGHTRAARACRRATIRAAIEAIAAAPGDRPRRPLLRPSRRSARRPSGDARRVRRAGRRRARSAIRQRPTTAPRACAKRSSIAERDGLPSYVALQPEYNLMDRDSYEGELAAVRERRPCLRALLRAGQRLPDRQVSRGRGPSTARARRRVRERYLNERGLAVLDSAREDRRAPRRLRRPPSRSPGSRMQPTVVAPIASATSPEQLAELVASVGLRACRTRSSPSSTPHRARPPAERRLGAGRRVSSPAVLGALSAAGRRASERPARPVRRGRGARFRRCRRRSAPTACARRGRSTRRAAGATGGCPGRRR